MALAQGIGLGGTPRRKACSCNRDCVGRAILRHMHSTNVARTVDIHVQAGCDDRRGHGNVLWAICISGMVSSLLPPVRPCQQSHRHANAPSGIQCMSFLCATSLHMPRKSGVRSNCKCILWRLESRAAVHGKRGNGQVVREHLHWQLLSQMRAAPASAYRRQTVPHLQQVTTLTCAQSVEQAASASLPCTCRWLEHRKKRDISHHYTSHHQLQWNHDSKSHS